MSGRPKPTPSRPKGSTHASSAKTIPQKLARAKQWDLSPYPRKTNQQKRQDKAVRRRRF